jgi:hypothetical protein
MHIERPASLSVQRSKTLEKEVAGSDVRVLAVVLWHVVRQAVVNQLLLEEVDP